MKICSKCSAEKEIREFPKDKNTKDGLSYCCKQCKYKVSNKLKIKLYCKLTNLDYIKLYKQYRINNYLELNRDKQRVRTKKWSEINQLRINDYKRNKYKTDPFYKLKINIRNTIYKSFKKTLNGNIIKSKRSVSILGCSFEDFKTYLESKFEYWMTWDNHGKYNGEFNYGWDIDHIIPISSSKTKEDILRLNYYTNFQPLCSKVNRDIKRDNI